MLAQVLCTAVAAGAPLMHAVTVRSGPCGVDANGTCFTSPGHPSAYGHGPSHTCEFEVTQLAVIRVVTFHTEVCCDHLTFDNRSYSGNGEGLDGSTVRPGTILEFSPDNNSTGHGFKLCLEEREDAGSLPTRHPTTSPTFAPSVSPTFAPTVSPTGSPNSSAPTGSPTAPTVPPSVPPTLHCRLTMWNFGTQPVYAGEDYPGEPPSGGVRPFGQILNMASECDGGVYVHVLVYGTAGEQRIHSVGCNGRFELHSCPLPRTDQPTGGPTSHPITSLPTTPPTVPPTPLPTVHPSVPITFQPTAGPSGAWPCSVFPGNARVGMLVVPGVDWTFGNQNGGRRFHGTLVKRIYNHNCQDWEEQWLVRWWFGGTGVYPVGCGGSFSLRDAEKCGIAGTVGPSPEPTVPPSVSPTAVPSGAPTSAAPTAAPSSPPTLSPSAAPPTGYPTMPSGYPDHLVTGFPTRARPTRFPSRWPTGFPATRTR
eukprot:TRINITY_DN2627_c0_g1_i1.p1 TRINITY_DN2627_c0_g1~~TRINITY_DN2627_c0_g1_i1.p1  ORF type:complete len:509 (+),score=85.96 TRINITY_DN2627_c0_g1_i1:92-1528(+)